MDYVLKGFMDARTLDRVLRHALARDIFEGSADLLRDSMTGLYSREGLLTLGTRCQEEAQRTGGELVLICALFENLLTPREGFGPGAADHAVRDLAQLLAGSCRRSDLVARLGQAPFAVLAVDAVAPSAPVMRQRLESTSRFTTRRVRRGARSICVSASEGGARRTSAPSARFSMQFQSELRPAPEQATTQQMVVDSAAGR
jgi:diguanylate cyclase (GGDEF)-like protein